RSGEPAALLPALDSAGQHQLRLLLGAPYPHRALQRASGNADSLHRHQHVLSFLRTLFADLHRWAGPDAVRRKTVSGTEAAPAGTNTCRAVNEHSGKTGKNGWVCSAGDEQKQAWPRLCNKCLSPWQGV
ncbi:unnamed protein product, partial [Gulo gulo]